MTTVLPPLVAAYVQATNTHDAAAFGRLFAEDAVVDDNFREIRGLPAIQQWSAKEIFAAQVTLEVLSLATNEDHVVITTKVDGTFDRTGLPDPLLISHDILANDGQIVTLQCRLVNNPPTK